MSMSRWEPEPLPPLRAALISQVLGTLMAAGLAALAMPGAFKVAVVPFFVLLGFAALQGILSAFVSYKLEAPRWWLFIHTGFLPLVVFARQADIAPNWYLLGFVLLLLVFWRTDKSRVPLYLTNATAAKAVAELLPAGPCRVIDLGCGDGRLLKSLARARPDCEFIGIEHAPLTWLWARINTLGLPNCRIRHGDFWTLNLVPFDVVYAFLSPVPMTPLWSKARAEMRAGSLLISNSFAIPAVEAERVIDVPDRRATRLYCYTPTAG